MARPSRSSAGDPRAGPVPNFFPEVLEGGRGGDGFSRAGHRRAPGG
jgi:hypothetical protein